jgi:hypothetical protein
MIKAAASAFFMPLIYLHMLFSQLNPIQNYMMVEFYAIMYHSAPERVQQWLYVKDPEVQYETHELYPRGFARDRTVAETSLTCFRNIMQMFDKNTG